MYIYMVILKAGRILLWAQVLEGPSILDLEYLLEAYRHAYIHA